MVDAPLLVDADILLYRAAAACEHEVCFDEDNHILTSNNKEAWDAVEHQINMYREQLGDGPMHFALTGSDNFRRKLWDGYKGGRTRKPLCYGYLRDRLIGDHGARFVDTLEADDLLGIWATGGRLKDAIIVSLDKDLRTIPGRVWRHAANSSQEHQLFTVTEQEADYFWMTQTLTGDATDGYKGLPGTGPKTAEKILAGVSSDGLWGAVVSAFEAKGLTEDDALLQARLSRILRASDWDSNKKEVILWNPPSR